VKEEIRRKDKEDRLMEKQHFHEKQMKTKCKAREAFAKSEKGG
jgi:hypothetical protein